MQNQTVEQQELAIQRIYIKNSSFEAFHTPLIFQETWKPELHVDIQSDSTSLGKDHYEVVLIVSIAVKSNQKDAFLVKIKEAGIFIIKHFSEAHLKPILGSICPGILYPYARADIAESVLKGGFPPLHLALIDFDAAYRRAQEEEKNLNNHVVISETVQ